MNVNALVEYLIDGGLIEILKQGDRHPVSPWIQEDESGRHGFRTYYPPYNHTYGDRVGGQEAPQNSTDGSTIDETSEEDVLNYLKFSFKLDDQTAERVLREARPRK